MHALSQIDELEGMTMRIPCAKCGALNWLENEVKCHLCLAVLRRCIDCAQLDPKSMECTAYNYDMTHHQAEKPATLSPAQPASIMSISDERHKTGIGLVRCRFFVPGSWFGVELFCTFGIAALCSLVSRSLEDPTRTRALC